MLGPTPRDRVLDLATGTGELPRRLAGMGTSRRPERLLGLDRSAEMLARAPTLPDGWELREGDASDTDEQSGSFELVTCSYLLHLLDAPDRLAVLGEAARVLRPGGRLGLITVAPPRTPVGRISSAPVRALARRSRGTLAGLRPHDPGPELPAAGLVEVDRAYSYRGYPSLLIVARTAAA